MTNPSPEDPHYEQWLHELKRRICDCFGYNPEEVEAAVAAGGDS